MFDKRFLESAELYDKRYRNFATLVVMPVLALVVGLVAFTVFGQKQLTVTTVGDVEPTRVIAQVQSASPDAIVENRLTEGGQVDKGDLLIKYDGTTDSTQLAALQAQLAQAQVQRQALGTLQASVDAGTSQFTTPDGFGYSQEFQAYLAQRSAAQDDVDKANQGLSDANTAVARQKTALQGQIDSTSTQIGQYQQVKNAVSDDDPGRISKGNPYASLYDSYQQQATAQPDQKKTLRSQSLASIQSSLDSLQASEQSLKTQLAGLQSSNAFDNSLSAQLAGLQMQELEKTSQDMTSLDSTIADLTTKITLQRQVGKDDSVLAGATGVLHVLPGVLGVGKIPAGTPVAEIYPTLKSGAEVDLTVYVSGEDIAAIRLGQTMRLNLAQNLPDPLVLTGRVTHIDSAPTATRDGNVFKVQAQARLAQTDLRRIRYGLQGQVSIVTGQKTYFNYFKDKILNSGQQS